MRLQGEAIVTAAQQIATGEVDGAVAGTAAKYKESKGQDPMSSKSDDGQQRILVSLQRRAAAGQIDRRGFRRFMRCRPWHQSAFPHVANGANTCAAPMRRRL